MSQEGDAIRAVVFDMDGTLVQTERLKAISYARAAVEPGKPDPEIYYLVCEALGTPPGRSLAIEDSPPGVEAALAADLRCIAVTTPLPGRRSILRGCWLAGGLWTIPTCCRTWFGR